METEIEKISGFAAGIESAVPERAALFQIRGMIMGRAISAGLLASREALIKSLSDFILGFLCNARNNPTRIASYLRRIMTKQCIKILMKSDSAN
ncbi:hypothetical protein [Dialister sp.]|uniref:hypothetical protein n=1 Tax=Dialister sp. TaxID=1955814 RepID=UPI0025D346F1|nr:hypothetical protein [Dialister sp.]